MQNLLKESMILPISISAMAPVSTINVKRKRTNACQQCSSRRTKCVFNPGSICCERCTLNGFECNREKKPRRAQVGIPSSTPVILVPGVPVNPVPFRFSPFDTIMNTKAMNSQYHALSTGIIETPSLLPKLAQPLWKAIQQPSIRIDLPLRTKISKAPSIHADPGPHPSSRSNYYDCSGNPPLQTNSLSSARLLLSQFEFGDSFRDWSWTIDPDKAPSEWTVMDFFIVMIDSGEGAPVSFLDAYFARVYPKIPALSKQWAESNFVQLPLFLLHAMYACCIGIGENRSLGLPFYTHANNLINR